jgi:menaquinone-dependent protoporphyrinogen oxidase
LETRVLVAYASKHGMTAEIAGKIGDTLRQSGLQVDVVAVKKIKGLEVYNAIVLGSAVYIAMWRKEMVKFLQETVIGAAGLVIFQWPVGRRGSGRIAAGLAVPRGAKTADRAGKTQRYHCLPWGY